MTRHETFTNMPQAFYMFELDAVDHLHPDYAVTQLAVAHQVEVCDDYGELPPISYMPANMPA